MLQRLVAASRPTADFETARRVDASTSHSSVVDPNPLKARLAELDGLRAVAILMVLAGHFLKFPRIGHSVASYLSRIPSGGWGGVDVFFVLSGFLVGGILIDGREKKGTLRNFFVRRAMRILPLYIFIVVSFYIFRNVFPRADWLFVDAVPWWSYLTLTQNFMTPVLGSGAFYLGPTWSLAVEVQIYLILAFLLTRIPLNLIVPIMIFGVILAESFRLLFIITNHGIYGYFFLPARIDGACFGVLATLATRSKSIHYYFNRYRFYVWTVIFLLFAIAESFSVIGQGPGSLGADVYTHLALSLASSATIVMLIAKPTSVVNLILRSKPLVSLGTISYGVYLIHLPVMGLVHAISGRTNVKIDSWSTAAISSIGLVLAILLSILSWRYFESPLIKYSHRLSSSDARIAPAALPNEPAEPA